MGGKLKIKVKDTPASAENAPPVPSRKVSITPKPADSPKSPSNNTDSTTKETDAPATESASKADSPAAESPKSAASEEVESPKAAAVEPEAADKTASSEPEAADDSAAKEKEEADLKQQQEQANKDAELAKKKEEADLKEQDRLKKEQEKADLKAAKLKEKEDKIAEAALIKASMDAATDSETRAFLLQSNTVLEEKNVAVSKLNDWNEKILVFFAFQRAPYLQKLNNALARVTNGEQALNEAKEWIKFMSNIHGSSGNKLKGVSFFGNDLHKGKKAKSVPELPPSGDSDPSVLALSHLTQLSYSAHEKHVLVVNDLKIIGENINKLTKNYGTKAQKELQKMLQQVKDCEDSSTEVDKCFKKHCDHYTYYLHAMRGQNGSAASKLTSSSRKDMWKSEQVYRERVIALTAQHKVFFTQCTALLEDLHKAEQERALKLHNVLAEVSNLYVQYYAGMHSIAIAAHTSVQGSVQNAVTNYQMQREQQQQQQLELAAQSAPKRSSSITATAAANEKLVKPEPPGPFPTNVSLYVGGSVQMEKGFFKKWKKFYMVLTKDHYLHAYSLDDVDTSGENAEIFGSGTGTFSTTTDASKVRFLLKDNKSADGAETWIADGLDCTAEPAPKGDSSFLLKVQPPGLFSSNWDTVVKCDSVTERDMWMKAINDNTSPTRKAALNVQPPAAQE